MMKNLLTALRERRSIYGISKESTISDQRIQEIIEETVTHTPSAFNNQTTRVVLLLGEQHNKLWDITTEVLKTEVPAEQFSSTQEKMNVFRSGYGTVLFFEDQSIIDSFMEQYPSYQEHFPIWSQQTNGMHQLVIWTALEAEGLGVNLQHYNPLIDERVKAEWKLPEGWKLTAQMPFGKPTASAGEKGFNPVQDRIKVFK
ncbi:nitroreductase family protein [Paenibacillus anseongense]|uniref:nitroreductase family protein n=1 Tax=Paenibacillus anseongense TaxID=2682845 RepID=UPI002DB88992|nr:nitroreductase family protein [Paenibacillus anseongense]MEC0264505.1 nitroreductase family protein [Paenibacillus anseongense]